MLFMLIPVTLATMIARILAAHSSTSFHAVVLFLSFSIRTLATGYVHAVPEIYHYVLCFFPFILIIASRYDFGLRTRSILSSSHVFFSQTRKARRISLTSPRLQTPHTPYSPDPGTGIGYALQKYGVRDPKDIHMYCKRYIAVVDGGAATCKAVDATLILVTCQAGLLVNCCATCYSLG